jgi:hypothetical protein
MIEIKPDKLASAVNEILQAYGKDVQEALGKAIDEATKEGLGTLRKSGSYGGSGKYRKSFAIEKKNTVGGVSGVLYVKSPRHGLAHLLEHGHRTKNGGYTRAFPHWAVAESIAESKFVQSLESGLGKI